MQKIINNNIREKEVGFDNAKLLKERGLDMYWLELSCLQKLIELCKI